jgi:ATP-dependent Clp protease ATP-binding subunit ClpA
VLDEGFFTTTSGKKINFKNYIIIATSNACAELISDSVKKGLAAETIAKQVIDTAIKEGIFKPEFLNRFEGVIFFEPLKPESIQVITRMMLEKYAKRLKDEKNIEVKFESNLVEAVSQKAFNTMFGARAINRFIEDQIGDKIVKKIIAKEVEEGKSFNFSAVEIS